MNKISIIRGTLCSLILFVIHMFFVANEISAAASSLFFSPDNLGFEANANKSTNIFLDTTGDKIVGVDLIIDYDSGALEITSVEDLKIFSYKTKEIIDNSAGHLKVAFSNDYGKTFSGSANIATINFKFKNNSSSSSIHFVYVLGHTNDTNVVNVEGRDVLNNVGNLNIVSSSSATAVPTSNVLGNANKPAKKPEKDIIPPKKPTEADFVFPNNIEQAPQVLGEGTSQPVEIKQSSHKLFILISVFALVAVLIVIGSFIYLKKHKDKWPDA